MKDQNSKILVKLKANNIYSFCPCGLSEKYPFCDGSHKKEGRFRSVKFLAEKDEELEFKGFGDKGEVILE